MSDPISLLLGESTMDGVTRHIRRHYLENENEAKRISRASDRADLYRSAGDGQMIDYIDKVFDDDVVKELRRRFVETAKSNNVTKRVVNEIATLYAKAPKRRVTGAENNAKYQEFLRGSRQNAKMRRADRMLELHRQILTGFRVWDDDTGQRRHSIHVVTPDSFYAMRHPDDPMWSIGYIIDQLPMLAEGQEPNADDPRYLVWTNHETFKLTHSGLLIGSTYEEHPFEVMPWLLASADESETALLDNQEGSDLTAAHKSVWFQDVMLLKESGSLNKQTAFAGDLRTTPTGQSADSQRDLILGDGVSVQTIDRGVELGQYRDAGDHILEHAAANYGIPPSVLKHQGATSGFEIELRRIGIRERRTEREGVFRDLERDLAKIQAMVLGNDDPGAAFTTDGWSINFAETETPMDRGQQLDIFLKERQAGLTNTQDMINRNDPDLTPAGAGLMLLKNIALETERVRNMRELQAMSGAMGSDAPSPEPPADDESETHTSQAVNGRATKATTAQVGGN